MNMRVIFPVMKTTQVVVKVNPEKKNQACTRVEHNVLSNAGSVLC